MLRGMIFIERKPKIIHISGKADHGKDTFASMLKEALEKLESASGEGNNQVLITHYADPVKFVCTNFFGWNGSKFGEGRTLLQYVGTDVGRCLDENYWVDILFKFIDTFAQQFDYIIIPDCRFENEIHSKDNMWFRGYKSIHIRVNRPGYKAALTDEHKSHSSETSLDDATPDMIVENTSMERLQNYANFFASLANGYFQNDSEKELGIVKGVIEDGCALLDWMPKLQGP